MLPSLQGAKRIAVDTETCDPTLEELGPGVRRGAYIAGIAVAVDNGPRVYLPIRHDGGDNVDPGLVLRWARDELIKFDGELVGANLLYDLDFLAEEGIHFPKVKKFLDVQVAEPLLDEHRLQYNLDSLAHDYLGEQKVEAMLREAAVAMGFGASNKDIKSNLWRLPGRYVGPYGEGDVDLPLRILPLQMKKLADEGLTELFDLESRLIPLLLAMRRRGVRINTGKVDEVRAKLVVERDLMLGNLRRLAGPTATFMAPESFAPALREAGLKFPMTGKTGKPSITKGWLVQHKEHPLVAAIMRGRRVETIINTFIDGHIGRHLINGRIHCEFHQLKGDDGGTIARFSSSSPNLQNLPARDEEIGPLVRGLFIPEDGEDWNRIDLSQIEYRFAVHYAIGEGADEARRSYNEDPKTDFHKLCAVMAGKDPNDKYVRKAIKNVNFAKLYGGGIPKIAATMGVSVEEATEFVNTYDARLPFVKKTLEAATQAAKKRGYVKTILGRRQRFNLWEPPGNYTREFTPLPREQAREQYGDNIVRAFTYASLNRVLQGSAADQMKCAMVNAWEAGVCDVIGPFLITVHDELDNSVPRTKEGREAVMELKRHMENAIKLKVPVIAEMEQGPDWGHAE
jgi:DNA polymerase I-like protein with 3'-5' exonuclease and polymerase domains